jgi:hypothetical protein
MLFIIPVKSAQISPSWVRFTKLFERCIRSVCQQTDQDFIVIVVCHEKPETAYQHPNIHYHQVDFPPPSPDNGTVFKLNHSDKEADKAKKILAGIEFGTQFNKQYAMVVDADDCINNQIVSFVRKNSDEPGWYFNSGYIYKEGSKFIFKKMNGFNGLCGTCIIVRTSYLKDIISPDMGFRHQKKKLDNGIQLKPLPFEGAVYSITNGENYLMTANTVKHLNNGITIKKNSYLHKVQRLIKKALNYRIWLLNNTIKNKFGLYQIGQSVAE